METIILASSGSFFTDQLENYLDKPLKSFKIAYIPTASAKVEDLSYIEQRRPKMAKMGLDLEEIDIASQKEEDLRKILGKKNLVFVEGGNTFYLLKCIRKSGFDRVIRDLLKKGLIYFGSSAGAYVACPTIEMTTWKLSNYSFSRCKVTDFSAMNLVPFLVNCHFRPEIKEFLKKKKKELKYPLKILTDKQAFLIKDDKVKIIGKGREIIV